MATVNWQCPNEWSEWSDWLAAGLHARNRWRLPVLGGHPVCRRAADRQQLAPCGRCERRLPRLLLLLVPPGRKAGSVATQLFLLVLRTLPLPDRLLVVIDDSPTKRYGPKAEGADIHRNPTPWPRRPKVPLWTHLGHAVAGVAASVVGPAGVAAAGHALRASEDNSHHSQESRLAISDQARIGGPPGEMDCAAGRGSRKDVVGGRRWRVYQGALLETGSWPPADHHRPTSQGCRVVRPAPRCGVASNVDGGRKYGKNRISLAKRAGHKQGWQTIECTVYGKTVTKTYKTSLATYRSPVECDSRGDRQRRPRLVSFFATDPQVMRSRLWKHLPIGPRSSRTSTT